MSTSTTTGFMAPSGQALTRRTDTLPLDQMEQGQGVDEQALTGGPRLHEPRLKVTAWRILNTTAVLALGTYKALSTYRGQSSALTTFEWISSTFWVLIAYWGSLVEQEAPTIAPWLFTHDLSPIVGFVLAEIYNLYAISLIPFMGRGFLGGNPEEHPTQVWLVMLALSLFVPPMLWMRIVDSGLVNRFVKPWFKRFCKGVLIDENGMLRLKHMFLMGAMAGTSNIVLTTLILYEYQARSMSQFALQAWFLGATILSLVITLVACGLYVIIRK
ncbi:hypothetical protein DFH09DRAFT_1365762 [Mycena vulgaris]|nr:hypothetical protein DFH09DRAFT_1365762 [Mycena vulgaris]